MTGASPSLASLTLIATSILVFRALPVTAYCVVSPRSPALLKVSFVSAFGAGVIFLANFGLPVSRTLGHASWLYLYFFPCVWLVSICRRRQWLSSSLGSLLCCLLLFCVAPVYWPLNTNAVQSVALGWEIALCSYSYLADKTPREEGRFPAAAAFFILIDPVLVYPDRSRAAPVTPQAISRGTLRIVLGIAAVSVQLVLVVHLQHWQPVLAGWGTAGQLLALYGLGVGFYLAHSGLASMQIGLMRLCGWDTPERYRFPFLATSPKDFWRRWNVWLGRWAFLYVFVPVAKRLGRLRTGDSWRGIAVGLAVIMTFLAIGGLHDLAMKLSSPSHGWWLPFAMLFLVLGASLVVWEIASGKRRRPRAQIRLLPLHWSLFTLMQTFNVWLASDVLGVWL